MAYRAQINKPIPAAKLVLLHVMAPKRNADRLLTREQTREYVDQRLDDLYHQYKDRAENIDGTYADLVQEMHTFITRGGKRLRPYLTYVGYAGFGGKDVEGIMDVAASQEVLHNFLLIHDDIIDRDTWRYNGANITGVYEDRFKNSRNDTDAVHYAQSAALLAGDTNHILATELITGSSFSPEAKLEAVQWVHSKTLETIGGQFLDLSLAISSSVEGLNHEQLLSVARYKTASYSFECPLVLGSMLAGADQSALRQISEFARAAGIMYQLHDDVLGIFGDADHTGKPALSDLHEGKQTLLMHYGFLLAKPEQRAILEKRFANTEATEYNLSEVREVLEATGAKDEVLRHIQSFRQEAERALSDDVMQPEARKILKEIVRTTL